jgi:hypothetical protein
MATSKESNVLVRPRSGEVIPQAPGEFPLVESDRAMQEIVALIDDNLAAQKMSVLQFPHIKAPSGGGMALTIDTASGKESEREVRGIIVAFRQARVFWKRAYGTGGGKKPPDCSSNDGFLGVGDPGGACDQCPFAQFGTAVNPDGSHGAGQACKDIRQMLVLLPGQLLPHLFAVPPTSIKAFSQYIWNLTSEGSRYWGVITRIVPEASTSTGGIDYARLRFLKERPLDPAQATRVNAYHDRMQAFLKPMTVDASAYEVVGEEPAPPSEPAPNAGEETDLPF